MTEKKQSYRVNFTMPTPDDQLSSKINELFERHREIGTLRHWLMALATEDARKELGIAPTVSPGKPKPPSAPVKPKKAESFADLLTDDSSGREPVVIKRKSRDLEAYESMCDAVRSEAGYDPEDAELNDALEAGRPLRLSDL